MGLGPRSPHICGAPAPELTYLTNDLQSAMLEGAVTGQCELVANLHYVPPAVGKQLKLRHSVERKLRGPNISSSDRREERLSQTFKSAKRCKSRVPYLLDCQDSKDEAAEGTRTRIHQTVIGGGRFTFHVGGLELPAPSVILNSTEPHVHDVGNCVVLSECVSFAGYNGMPPAVTQLCAHLLEAVGADHPVDAADQKTNQGRGKDVERKSQKTDFPFQLANPANCAGFALYHRLGCY